MIGPGIPISRQDEDLLIAFLNALTDPAAATPVPAPTSVPSGLPVGD